MSEKEKSEWKEGLSADIDIQGFESGSMSWQNICIRLIISLEMTQGLLDLASSLGIPVLCYLEAKRTTDLWRPGWGKVKVVLSVYFDP